MNIIAYKSLNKGGISPIVGYKWPLPKGNKPGRWVKARGPLDLCNNGIHACRACRDLLVGQWLREELYLIELDGEILDGNNKCCAQRGRLISHVKTWNEQTARLFAADCAEAVAHLHPIVAPTVRVARSFAFGLSTAAELAAAWDAAWDAARAAAGDAAGAAARAAAGDAQKKKFLETVS